MENKDLVQIIENRNQLILDDTVSNGKALSFNEWKQAKLKIDSILLNESINGNPINEGIFGNIMNWLHDAFKGIKGDVDKLIADENVEKLIMLDKGTLSANLQSEIEAFKTDASKLKQVYDTVKSSVKTGGYFLQMVQVQEDGMAVLFDQSGNIASGEKAAGITDKNTPSPTASAQATSISKDTSAEFDKKVKEFDKVYNQQKLKIQADTQKKVQALLAKSKANGTKEYINERFQITNAVLAGIEYEVKKTRLDPSHIDAAKQAKAAAYSQAMQSQKALEDIMQKSKAEGGLDVNEFNKMDINAFLKQYPAELAKKGQAITELYPYPYELAGGAQKIVITAYDINANTVTISDVVGVKVGDPRPAPVPFDDFKAGLLAGSDGVPPKRQKGGVTAPAAKISNNKKENKAEVDTSKTDVNTKTTVNPIPQPAN